MKNLKKVLAFTLALAMVLSTMTTTFAADETVDKLSNLGLLLNTSEQEVNAELTRSVGLAMVLKALGYTQEDSNAKAAENTFIDMGLAEWAKGFAKIGEELKITNGISVEPKMFAPTQKLDKKSFVTFMLRALGYDTNEAWEKAAALAQEAKLVEEQTLEDANFTKGEAAMIMYNALKATVQEDAQKRSLAQKLVDEGKLNKDLAVANGVLEGAASVVEVMDVKADNLREVTVMFNTKLEKASAEKAGNYKLKGRSVGEATLQEDGKTVVLTLSGQEALINKRETKLTVMGVKSAEGVAIAKTEKMFTPYDNEYPKVEKVTFTGPKQMTILFSEPIREGYKGQKLNQVVTLKNGNRTYSTRIEEVSGKMAYVKAYTTFKDGEEYMVAIGDPKQNDRYFRDFANYPNVYYEETLTYTKDTTAPEAEVKSANQKVVKVEFNKPVKGINEKHFYHSFASYTALAVYSDAELKNKVEKAKSYETVYVQFYNSNNKKDSHALPAGNVTLTILGKADDKSQIEDNWGNDFVTTNYDLTIVADREAPEVVAVEVVSSKKIKVSFNEAVLKDSAKFTLSDTSGKVKEENGQIDKSYADGNKAVELVFDNGYEGKTMVLSIKGMKDASLYENMMADYSTEVDFTDKVLNISDWKAQFRKIAGTNGAKDTYLLYVTFAEDMGESALEAKNYKIQKRNDKTEVYTIKGGDGEFLAGSNSVVKFELSTEPSDDNDVKNFWNNGDPRNDLDLLVSRDVKDLAGNGTTAFQEVVSITPFVAGSFDGIKDAKANTPTEVVVNFNTILPTIDGKEFKVTGSEVTGYDVASDNKSVTLYLDNEKPLAADVKGVKVWWNTSTTDPYTANAFGEKLNGTQHKVEDAIKPAYAVFRLDKDNYSSSLVDAVTRTSGKKMFTLQNTEDNIAKYSDQVVAVGTKENTNEYTVRIGYTEPIDVNSVSNTTYEFNNGLTIDESKTRAEGYTVKVVLKKKDETATITDKDLKTLSFKQVNYVSDKNSVNNRFRDTDKEVKVFASNSFKVAATAEPAINFARAKFISTANSSGKTVATDVLEAFNNLSNKYIAAAQDKDAVVAVMEDGKYKIKIAYTRELLESDVTSTNFTLAAAVAGKFDVEVKPDDKLVVMTLTPKAGTFTPIDDLTTIKVNQVNAVKDVSGNTASAQNDIEVQNINAFESLKVLAAFNKVDSEGATTYTEALTKEYKIDNSLNVANNKPVVVITKSADSDPKYYITLAYKEGIDVSELNGKKADDYFTVTDTNIKLQDNAEIKVEGQKVTFEVKDVKTHFTSQTPKVTQKAKVGNIPAMSTQFEVYGDSTVND